jgi:hypothetical protein
MKAEVDAARHALRTPRSAAVSGIAFSLLLAASVTLVRLAIPDISPTQGAWSSDPTRRTALLVAFNLVPFSGIAFLWFIGVVRDRMGEHEDRFFASVFLGSGLLFVAMLFAGTAMAAGLIASLAANSSALPVSDAWLIARAVTYTLITTYAMRMAAVFMIATATITLRIAILPRWLVFLGYACALVLLLSSGFLPWVELLFPAWVFLVSMQILLATLHAPQQPHEAPSRASESRPARS